MPTASDLVTDLPADFETFGQAVATSMADLLGGTTGQVLSKASNTDMDFTWVAQDDSNAIQNAIVDAKGDLIAASANDTPARLAVGNNGETLVADSSQASGLKYTSGNPVPNPFINSAFNIAQRGTTFTGITSGTTYTLDRWLVYLGAAASVSVSQQATGDTTNLPQIKNCARVGRPNGNTAVTAINFGQIFENGNTSRYVGQVYNISFYARAGANFSAASSTLQVTVNYGIGTDQSWAGGVNSFSSISQGATLTTTWQRFTAQVSGLSGLSTTLAAAATQIAVGFSYTPVGTAGAADYFEVTGVQIDLGSTALPFRRNGATIQQELAACQRYYQVVGGVSGQPIVQSYTAASAFNQTPQNFPVQMRVAPTATKSGTWTVGSCGQPSASNLTTYGYALQTQKDGNLGTFYFYPDSSDDTITFSAEL